MFKLKGKTLFLLAVIIVGFTGVGFFFYTSLKSLNQQVESGVFPQKRTKYLKEITLNVNRLNNLYLVDSIRFSAQKADTIINIIEKNLDSIQMDYYLDNTGIEKKLDTIPKLLKIIQQEYLQLEKERRAGQTRFLNDLEGILQNELAELNLSSKDSITIIKQITSEIFNQDIDNIKSADTVEQAENRKSFFQRLFGTSSTQKKKEVPTQAQISITNTASQIKQKDTLVSTTVDTLLNASSSQGAPETKIITIFENIQRKRINLVDNLKSRETEIFQKNVEIINYIESLINDIIFEEINLFNNYVDDFSDRSKKYLLKTGIIIFIFMMIGVIAAYVIIKDINKSIFFQKQIENNQRRALLEAEEKQKFLYTMSHELRTPLTSIIGYSEALDQNDENVQAIKNASDYLYHMTNEILDMAKIKAGIMEIENHPFDLNTVLERLKTNFKPLIKQKGLQPIFEFSDEPIYIVSDQHRLQQIVYNLMHNALKFTESGFIKMGFSHQEKEKKIALTIYVEDTGCGMSPEEKIAVFKDYQQAGTHKNKIKGTGLGMGIVKTFVDKMGGKMQLQSELGKGSRFDMHFEFEKANENQINNAPKEITLSENALSGKTIYVLDDDALITRLYQKILNTFGAQVTIENNPLNAKIHLLEHQHYDMVIFDLKMPQLKGNELLEQLIKAQAKPKNCVVSTANVLISNQDKTDLEIFDYQIYKPIKRQDLVKLLVQVFNLQAKELEVKPQFNQLDNNHFTVFHSLEPLKVFVDDDQQELFEMLQLLLSENEKELYLLQEHILIKDHEACANIIHKISSRYAQLQIEPPISTKDAELSLRQASSDSINMTVKLYEFWTECNSYLQEVYKTKQQL